MLHFYQNDVYSQANSAQIVYERFLHFSTNFPYYNSLKYFMTKISLLNMVTLLFEIYRTKM